MQQAIIRARFCEEEANLGWQVVMAPQPASSLVAPQHLVGCLRSPEGRAHHPTLSIPFIPCKHSTGKCQIDAETRRRGAVVSLGGKKLRLEWQRSLYQGA